MRATSSPVSPCVAAKVLNATYRSRSKVTLIRRVGAFRGRRGGVRGSLIEWALSVDDLYNGSFLSILSSKNSVDFTPDTFRLLGFQEHGATRNALLGESERPTC